MSLLFGFILISISLVLMPIRAQDVCVKKGPCTCEFSNGTGIDLTPSAKESFFTAQIFEVKKNGTEYEMSTYYYHPCTDILPKLNASKDNNTCLEPLSICRSVDTMSQQNGTIFKLNSVHHDFMGTSNLTEFLNNGHSIKYFNGPSNTQVLLICADTEDELHVYSLAEPNDIVLSFYSRNACLRQIAEPGRSLGSTLCIVFFSCVIFYLVLGIGTKKFLMGATGIEVVPNVAFWSDLPNLVKDGWAFTLNGFKLPVRGAGPITSPDPNSYDSI